MRLSKKIFFDYGLLQLLVSKGLSKSTIPGEFMTLDEARLATRAFATLKPELIIE